MLGMGLTLNTADFRRVLQYPKSILLGIFLQYSIMPFSSFFIARLFQLPDEFIVGMVLVGSCPGGTASNVISYIAKANVALSVSMTALSTLLAVFLTPTLSTVLASSTLEVNSMGLLISTFEVVIIPVSLGIILNTFFHRSAEKLSKASPFIAVIFIVLIVASILGSSSQALLQSGPSLLLAVFTLHSIGFVSGYFISFVLNRDKIISRTISIEVGMQNSGLAVHLANQNFTQPLIAVPGAISSLIHSIIGSILAAIWNKK